MTERRSRIDHMAGPTYASGDFEGATIGAPELPELACPAGNGRHASLDGPATVEPAADTPSPRVSAAHPSFPTYTWQEVEAIHDLAIERAECYVDPATAIRHHELWRNR